MKLPSFNPPIGVIKVGALIYASIAGCLHSFSSDIVWLRSEYDYGVIEESNGKTEGKISFVNVGNSPTFIVAVKPGCGCTTASYTEGNILPGDTATVAVVYDPEGRPGKFTKSIKVYIGEDKELHTIGISGVVMPTLETLSLRYPHGSQNLRLEKREEQAGKILKGRNRHFFINAYNNGNDTLRIMAKCENGKALDPEFVPETLLPYESGVLSMYLNTSEESLFGPVSYNIKVAAEGRNHEIQEEKVTLNVVVAPEQSYEAKARNGYIALRNASYNMGEDLRDGYGNFEFEIENQGDAPLEIWSVFSQDDRIIITESPEEIGAGKRAKIAGALNLHQMSEGPFRIKVNVYSNDPLHPDTELNVIGIKGASSEMDAD